MEPLPKNCTLYFISANQILKEVMSHYDTYFLFALFFSYVFFTPSSLYNYA